MCKLSTDEQFSIKDSLKQPSFYVYINYGTLSTLSGKNKKRTQFNNLLRFYADRNHEEITDERLF